ncbi:MAG TPA: DUF5329 domain-containing protein [Dongiaceae bacterium]|nr:DUF5329 domain-containing protein [Dongiaceae bacterium]
MRRFKSAGLGLALAATLVMSAPAMAAGMSEEIDHLLDVIAASPCTFIRNGVAYDGAQAVDHIRSKYDHYREDIHSAEDFIALAASKSAMSGKPYLVACDGAEVPAAEWLTRELGAFRQRSGS